MPNAILNIFCKLNKMVSNPIRDGLQVPNITNKKTVRLTILQPMVLDMEFDPKFCITVNHTELLY